MLKSWLPRIGMAVFITAILIGGRLLFRRWPHEAGWWPIAAACAAVFVLSLAVETFHDKRNKEQS